MGNTQTHRELYINYIHYYLHTVTFISVPSANRSMKNTAIYLQKVKEVYPFFRLETTLEADSFVA